MGCALCRVVPVGLLVTAGLLTIVGCGGSNTLTTARMHMTNESESSVVFLAIEDSEGALSDAPNRLLHPLPPTAVFSAFLPRPGNYWVRAETIDGTTSVHRIEGPIRIDRGVRSWDFTREDVVPLYDTSTDGENLALVIIPNR